MSILNLSIILTNRQKKKNIRQVHTLPKDSTFISNISKYYNQQSRSLHLRKLQSAKPFSTSTILYIPEDHYRPTPVKAKTTRKGKRKRKGKGRRRRRIKRKEMRRRKRKGRRRRKRKGMRGRKEGRKGIMEEAGLKNIPSEAYRPLRICSLVQFHQWVGLGNNTIPIREELGKNTTPINGRLSKPNVNL